MTAKTGIKFYVNGARLLWQDLRYASSLVSKAAFAQYNLTPREVRTLRRTGKDLFTVVPFIIILIIPLSPIGHVLVFSFIQKFFPGFFPSQFTDERQNVFKLYEEKQQRIQDRAGELGEDDGSMEKMDYLKVILAEAVDEMAPTGENLDAFITEMKRDGPLKDDDAEDVDERLERAGPPELERDFWDNA